MKRVTQICFIIFIIILFYNLNNIRISVFYLPNLKNEIECKEEIVNALPDYQDVELGSIVDSRIISSQIRWDVSRIVGSPTDYIRWFTAYKIDPVFGARINSSFVNGIITSKLKVYVANYNGAPG